MAYDINKQKKCDSPQSKPETISTINTQSQKLPRRVVEGVQVADLLREREGFWPLGRAIVNVDRKIVSRAIAWTR